MFTKPKRPALLPTTEVEESMGYPSSEEEYKRGIAALKNNKAAGKDDVRVEQLNNIGPKTPNSLKTRPISKFIAIYIYQNIKF